MLLSSSVQVRSAWWVTMKLRRVLIPVVVLAIVPVLGWMAVGLARPAELPVVPPIELIVDADDPEPAAEGKGGKGGKGGKAGKAGKDGSSGLDSGSGAQPVPPPPPPPAGDDDGAAGGGDDGWEDWDDRWDDRRDD
jgi:hypothetical protein